MDLAGGQASRLPAFALVTLAFACNTTDVKHDVKHEPHAHHGGHHRFDDAAKWSAVFDSPERDAWQKPDAVIAALALAPTDVVTDIGAGTGYFSMRIARAVPEGKVLAVDIEPAMVAHLTQRAASEKLTNVVAVEGGTSDPKLPERANVALMVDTAHHIEGRTAYFTTLRAQMAPGARLVVVEFHADRDGPVGPPKAMRISHEQLARELSAAGWTQASVDVDTLPHQYIASYRAP
jgi:ubiquinone/menaquinone biosynthesis C-methylase UbiE